MPRTNISRRLAAIHPPNKEPRRKTRSSLRYVKVANGIVYIVGAGDLMYYDTYDNFILDVGVRGETFDPIPANWHQLYWSNDEREGHFFCQDDIMRRYPIDSRRVGQLARLTNIVPALIATQDARDLANGEDFYDPTQGILPQGI